MELLVTSDRPSLFWMPSTPGDRLRELREGFGLGVREVARLSEGAFTHSYVSNLENGVSAWSKASLTTLKGFARAFGISVDELIRRVSDDEGDPPKPQPKLSGFRLAPILGAVNAGLPHDYPVPSKLYRACTGVYQVQGESMTTGDPDSIQDGDWLLIDRSVTEIQDGKVYVFEILGDGYTVKRARKFNGAFYLVSDNPEHPSFKPSEVRVIGQVYYAFGGRKV